MKHEHRTHAEHAAEMGVLVRLANAVNTAVGHPWALLLGAGFVAGWIWHGQSSGYDPFPFGILANLIQVSSLILLLAANVSMMVQNRVADERERRLADSINHLIERVGKEA